MSHSARIAVVLLSLLAAPSGAARAQQIAYAANVMTELDSATQAALTREINAARDRGLPIEPLIAKVREGRTKQAAPYRIRGAVAALAKRLDTAREALGANASAEELSASADALNAGADIASLRAIRAASTKSIAAPIGTLAQLLLSGVEQKRAVEMIINLLRRNASPAQVVALGNLVEADVASGLKPTEAAPFRLRGIEATLATGDKVSLTSTTGGPSVIPTNPPGKPHRQP